MKVMIGLLSFAVLMASSSRAAPPMPVYDGCVQGDSVRIVTGPKRVLGKDQKPIDLSPFAGKRIRFKGYLLEEPSLVMVADRPTVVGPCRGAPGLPQTPGTIEEAIGKSRQLPVSKSGGQPGPCMAAVVRSKTQVLHSGEIHRRQLLSGFFEIVEPLAGPWPESFKLVYLASVPDNERAIMKREQVILIPVQDKRAATFQLVLPVQEEGAAIFQLGKVLENTPENLKRVRLALGKCSP